MNKILNLIKKEFKQIFRSKQTLIVIFGLPIIQLILIGFAISSEVKNISFTVVDYDRSKLSRELSNSFDVADRFDFKGYSSSISEAEDLIQKWKVQTALIIPNDFEKGTNNGLNPKVLLIVDGLDGNTAGIAASYASGILEKKNFELQNFSQNDIIKYRMWYNPEMKASMHMIPGLVVVLMTVLSLMLSSMSIVKEKEIGTLEQLIVTPIKKHELLLGKLIPYLILSIIEFLLVFFIAQLVFGITMQGSYVLLTVCAVFFLISTLGLGTFISTLAGTQQQAMFISWFFMVFMILLSGLFIGIDNMPKIIQKINLLNPMSYFINIIREIFQKGSSFINLQKDIYSLLCFGLVIFLLSYFKFSKTVK